MAYVAQLDMEVSGVEPMADHCLEENAIEGCLVDLPEDLHLQAWDRENPASDGPVLVVVLTPVAGPHFPCDLDDQQD